LFLHLIPFNFSFIPWFLILIAPELFEPDGEIAKASDVYAFAIVCWEIVARSAPWEGRPLAMVKTWVSEGN
jgi:hypothetical protein